MNRLDAEVYVDHLQAGLRAFRSEHAPSGKNARSELLLRLTDKLRRDLPNLSPGEIQLMKKILANAWKAIANDQSHPKRVPTSPPARKSVEYFEPKRAPPAKKPRLLRARNVVCLIIPKKRRDEIIGDFHESMATAKKEGLGRFARALLAGAKIALYACIALKLRAQDFAPGTEEENETP